MTFIEALSALFVLLQHGWWSLLTYSNDYRHFLPLKNTDLFLTCRTQTWWILGWLDREDGRGVCAFVLFRTIWNTASSGRWSVKYIQGAFVWHLWQKNFLSLIRSYHLLLVVELNSHVEINNFNRCVIWHTRNELLPIMPLWPNCFPFLALSYRPTIVAGFHLKIIHAMT